VPCADSKFLVPLKRSPEFRALRPRLTGKAPHPVYDSWLDDGFHFFVFVLAPPQDGKGAAAEGGYAVFAMHPESAEPVSAITLFATETGREVAITDLRPPGGSHIAPLPEPSPGRGQS
jgi:hypothetical protein